MPCGEAHGRCQAVDIQGVVPLQLATTLDGRQCTVALPWRGTLRLLVDFRKEGLRGSEMLNSSALAMGFSRDEVKEQANNVGPHSLQSWWRDRD